MAEPIDVAIVEMSQTVDQSFEAQQKNNDRLCEGLVRRTAAELLRERGDRTASRVAVVDAG
jgi:hypothetical protein